jgi:hypothetical protein
VEVADMKALLEKETGKDLTLYFNQWYYGFGYPKFTITWFNNNNKLIIKSLQSTSSAKTPLFKTNVDYLIKRDNKVDTIITLYQSKNEQTYLIEGLTNVKSISLDPNNVIVNKVNSIKQDANLIAIKNMIPENLIQVYPIPARDMITIETQLNETWTLELYNEKGSLVHKSYGSDHVKSIPVHDFPQGAYFIKISTENTKAWSRAITIIH